MGTAAMIWGTAILSTAILVAYGLAIKYLVEAVGNWVGIAAIIIAVGAAYIHDIYRFGRVPMPNWWRR